MMERCYKRDDTRHWADYGGRGITVSDRWRDSFENFHTDMGDPPDGYTIDRIDVNGNYEPGNCRWADNFTQMRNTRKNRWYEWKGELRLMGDIARMEGVIITTLRTRLLSGMTVEAAVADCRRNSRAPYRTRARAQFAHLTTQDAPANPANREKLRRMLI